MLVAPLAAETQPPGKTYRIGYLADGTQIPIPFREALRQLGYVEGQNVVIEGRFAGQERDRLPHLAAELVQLKVYVIVTVTTRAALAAQQVTTTIPIVMAGALYCFTSIAKQCLARRL
jgi:putative ABC transport system substrate-binding protein